MAISIYRSTDTDAPVLSGLAGALITVLDACLVNGYTGKSALGWAKSYAGTNLATYRAAVGNRLYLGIDDTTTQSARGRGFQVASQAGCGDAFGTYPFPNLGQSAGGLYLFKSSLTTSVARPWVLISNGKLIYFYSDLAGNATGGILWCFGDISSYRTSDPNCTVFIAHDTNTINDHRFATIGNVGATVGGHFISMGWDAIVHSVPFGKNPMSGAGWGSVAAMAQSNGTYLLYPDPINGGMLLTPFMCTADAGIIRGILPGLWAPCHNAPMSTGDTLSGTTGTSLEGKTFECFKVNAPGGTNTCNVLIETSDTWN